MGQNKNELKAFFKPLCTIILTNHFLFSLVEQIPNPLFLFSVFFNIYDHNPDWESVHGRLKKSFHQFVSFF